MRQQRIQVEASRSLLDIRMRLVLDRSHQGRVQVPCQRCHVLLPVWELRVDAICHPTADRQRASLNRTCGQYRVIETAEPKGHYEKYRKPERQREVLHAFISGDGCAPTTGTFNYDNIDAILNCLEH